MPKRKDLTGLVTEGHTVVSFAGRDKHGAFAWTCQCHTCGRTYAASVGVAASDRPCGTCAHVQSNVARTTHGLAVGGTMHPLYKVWLGIKQRCSNPKQNHWRRYGGRGIWMHEPWVTDVAAFVAYVTGLPGYEDGGRSLDRINNDGGYEPGNLRWATDAEQSLNTSRNRYITHNGETRTVSEWAKITGLGQSFRQRVHNGETGDKLFGPIRRNRTFKLNGETHTLKEWETILGVKRSTLANRVRKGLPLNLNERT